MGAGLANRAADGSAGDAHLSAKGAVRHPSALARRRVFDRAVRFSAHVTARGFAVSLATKTEGAAVRNLDRAFFISARPAARDETLTLAVTRPRRRAARCPDGLARGTLRAVVVFSSDAFLPGLARDSLRGAVLAGEDYAFRLAPTLVCTRGAQAGRDTRAFGEAARVLHDLASPLEGRTIDTLGLVGVVAALDAGVAIAGRRLTDVRAAVSDRVGCAGHLASMRSLACFCLHHARLSKRHLAAVPPREPGGHALRRLASFAAVVTVCAARAEGASPRHIGEPRRIPVARILKLRRPARHHDAEEGCHDQGLCHCDPGNPVVRGSASSRVAVAAKELSDRHAVAIDFFISSSERRRSFDPEANASSIASPR